MEFITNIPYPWALVRYGKRRNIRLAFIVEVITENGHHDRSTIYRAHTRCAAGKWTKRPRRFTSSEIIKMWRHCPSESTIHIARAES